MSKPLALSKVMEHLRESWQSLPDGRKPNNNPRYTIADAGLAAFSTFFMQMPSFLAYQRAMAQSKGKSNSGSLFQVTQIPSDNQIRNLLDPLTPAQFHGDYAWFIQELETSGHLQTFRAYANTLLVALDGLTYHASTTIHCPAVEATPMKTPNRISCQLGVTQTNGTSTDRMQTPAIDE